MSLRVEIKIRMNQIALVNIAYCPQKRKLDEFLDYLALNFDKTTTENKPIILMGDYILNYFCKSEKGKVDTVLIPSDLNPINAKDPTRITSHNKTLIDFLKTDKYLKSLLVATFESLISSDHFSQLIIFKTVFGTTKGRGSNTYLSKGTIIKLNFRKR